MAVVIVPVAIAGLAFFNRLRLYGRGRWQSRLLCWVIGRLCGLFCRNNGFFYNEAIFITPACIQHLVTTNYEPAVIQPVDKPNLLFAVHKPERGL